MKPILVFFIFFAAFSSIQAQEILLLKSSGKVVIGDPGLMSTPDGYSLYVQKGVLTERVKVSLKETTQWSDDAFNHTPTIEAVKQNISKKSHLLGMPSAAKLVEEGYELKSMDAKLLAQIEWLWQHMIEVKSQNQALLERLEKLESSEKSNATK